MPCDTLGWALRVLLPPPPLTAHGSAPELFALCWQHGECWGQRNLTVFGWRPWKCTHTVFSPCLTRTRVTLTHNKQLLGDTLSHDVLQWLLIFIGILLVKGHCWCVVFFFFCQFKLTLGCFSNLKWYFPNHFYNWTDTACPTGPV